VETIFRQIYTDGRKLPNPDDVRPTWYGYSVGGWDGDTFVVDTLGFNDLGWLDAGGQATVRTCASRSASHASTSATSTWR
jgi:hypothetical protein